MRPRVADSKVTVLVTDDSAFMRTALSRMIESDHSLRVVGTAQNGMEALEKIAELDPDVVTLDVQMPVLNGLETLKRVMSESPRPVIMVSSLTQDGAETTIEALALGAFDIIPKELNYISLDIIKVQAELVTKIKAAAARRKGMSARVSKPQRPPAVLTRVVSEQAVPAIIAIGTSTGGPKALQEILPELPATLPVAVLVVQHMPLGFTGPFAKRLDGLCKLTVQEVQQGMTVVPGNIYLATAGKHMIVRRSGGAAHLYISDSPRDALHTPSVDVMMMSVAEAFHEQSMGIIMTGMGSDGALGMQAIFQQGGITVGQDEATCAVYGMPRSCAEKGILKRVVPLPDIPRQILNALRHESD